MYRRGVFFDESLQWLGSDSAEYIRPLPRKICEWTDDFICANEFNPCVGFKVTNIFGVEDAVQTTQPPTTVPPITGVLIAVGGNSSVGSEIYKSNDGGLNWYQATTEGGFGLYDVAFFNSTIGIAVGASGTVHRTIE